MSNSENTQLGKEFQEEVRDWFASDPQYIGCFEMEVGLPIGNPEKNHYFDIVNRDAKIVIECKRYTWTETGNVPSAKIRAINEAAFFMSLIKGDYTKYIVIAKSNHAKKRESLAEYYFRTYKHLLGRSITAEYDMDSRQLRIIN